MTENQKPIPIALAEWTDWFCRNVKDPQDFRWIHMADMADQLRSLYKQLDSQQHVMDTRLNKIIELETERDELLEALRMNAQSLAWLANGKCRGFHPGLPTVDESLDAARAAIAKAGGAA